MKMNLGEWVRSARQHKGMTQERLGELLHLTKGNISAWEKGRHEPSYDRLVEIAAITGYSLPAPDGPTGASWPLSDELLSALGHASPEILAMVENQSRVAVGLRTIEPGDSFTSGMDAAATFDATMQPDLGDARNEQSLDRGAAFDPDQELREALQGLARQLKRMSPTQRQAMVAELRKLGGTSTWGETRAKTPEELGEQTIDQDAPRRRQTRRVSR